MWKVSTKAFTTKYLISRHQNSKMIKKRRKFKTTHKRNPNIISQSFSAISQAEKFDARQNLQQPAKTQQLQPLCVRLKWQTRFFPIYRDLQTWQATFFIWRHKQRKKIRTNDLKAQSFCFSNKKTRQPSCQKSKSNWKFKTV